MKLQPSLEVAYLIREIYEEVLNLRTEDMQI